MSWKSDQRSPHEKVTSSTSKELRQRARRPRTKIFQARENQIEMFRGRISRTGGVGHVARLST